jgi:hypothetical protein
MTKKKPLKVVFAPGCFDDFDGTQEELAELIAQIHEMNDNGTLEAESTPIDELPKDEQEELLEIIESQIDKKRNLQ